MVAPIDRVSISQQHLIKPCPKKHEKVSSHPPPVLSANVDTVVKSNMSLNQAVDGLLGLLSFKICVAWGSLCVKPWLLLLTSAS
jgi:hypothetical protein